MTRSVRTRVALRYSLLFGLFATLIAVGIYKYLEWDAYRRLDEITGPLLRASEFTLQHEVEQHGGKQQGERALRQVMETTFNASFPKEQVAIWDGARLVAYKKNLGPVQVDLRTLGPPGRQPLRSDRDLRVATASLYIPAVQTTYKIAVSTWRGDTQNDLAALFSGLSIIVPLSLLLAGGAGYLLALRTLRPLTQIAEEIDTVNSKNLSKRIDVTSSHDEIQTLAAGFNRLLEHLEKAFEQQQRFMADASHELRTPISAALMAAQVTLKLHERSSEEYRQALQIIERQMLQLRRLVEDMFLLARADADSVPVRKEDCYLDELVAEGVAAMRHVANRFRVTLLLEKPLPETLICGDPGLLRQALTILLDNACKYTLPGGSVTVTLAADPGGCTLRVADTGVGIPEHIQPHLFERFFSGDTARAKSNGDTSDRASGAGLGLAIARWIAEQHDAKIALEQSSGKGSVFALQFSNVKSSSLVAKNATGV
jgi:signal transduction histidine kinase